MAGEGQCDVVIEVRADLEACLRQRQPSPGAEEMRPATATIFRVPPSDFRFMDEFTYTPKYVSIGPYHHTAGRDNFIHDIKMQALHDLLDHGRDGGGRSDAERLEEYAGIAFRRLDDVKQRYTERIELTDSDLVWMLVTDGCFIIEFLIKWYLNDPRIKKAVLPVVRTDLLLVENQIPFFILEEFFNACKIPLLPEGVGLMDLAIVYLSDDRVGAQRALDLYRYSEHRPAGIHHLLHLYHLMCLEPDFSKRVNGPPSPRMILNKLMSSPSPWHSLDSISIILELESACLYALSTYSSFTRPLTKKISSAMNEAIFLPFFLPSYLTATYFGLINNLTRPSARRQNLSGGIPNARYLRDSGFKFQKKEPLSSFSYVSLRGMTIEIPALSRDITPPVLLRNLIMFEEGWIPSHTSMDTSQPPVTCSVTSFVKLMDYLIATADDVAILKECGIIHWMFGDDETVATTWRDLCKDIILDDDHYLKQLFVDVIDYYDQHYHRVRFYQWMTSSPWAAPAIILTILGLALTFASTFATLYHYLHH